LEPIRHCYVNDKLNLTPESVLQNSPILLTNHFGKELDLFVGDAELPEMIALVMVELPAVLIPPPTFLVELLVVQDYLWSVARSLLRDPLLKSTKSTCRHRTFPLKIS
jgi:hypothetical protein